MPYPKSTLQLPSVKPWACSACLPCTMIGSGPAGRQGLILTAAKLHFDRPSALNLPGEAVFPYQPSGSPHVPVGDSMKLSGSIRGKRLVETLSAINWIKPKSITILRSSKARCICIISTYSIGRSNSRRNLPEFFIKTWNKTYMN
jgi:hypothetical protein